MKPGDLVWVMGEIDSVSPDRVKVWIRGINTAFVIVRPAAVRPATELPKEPGS